MYSHFWVLQIIITLIVGGIVLYAVHWLALHRKIYTRLFSAIVEVLLLLCLAFAYFLGEWNHIALFLKLQNEILAAIVYLFCLLGIKIADILVWNGLLLRNGQPLFPKILVRFINFMVMLVATFLIIQFIYNVNITQLLVASSLVAMILAYGGQSTLSNIFSGISLNIMSNIRIGDWIEIQAIQGQVISGYIESLDWRCITLKNEDENLIIIPNSVLAATMFINYSRPIRLYKAHFYMKVAYTVRPEEVIGYIKKALSENLGINQTKPLEAHMDRLEGDGMVYHIEFFTEKYIYRDIRDEVQRSVYYQIMRSQRSASPFSTHSFTRTPNDAVKINAEEIFTLLSTQPILNCLQQDELKELIQKSEFQRFTIDEILLHEGLPNTCIYILLNGALQVEKHTENELPIILASINDFAIIGEYSMLLDEFPRQTVRCIKESLVMIIQRKVFQEIILRRIEIIEAIKDIIESRQSKNVTEMTQHQKNKAHYKKESEGSVLDRLKKIFTSVDTDPNEHDKSTPSK